MITDIFQPSLKPREAVFGGAALRWPSPKGDVLLLERLSHSLAGGDFRGGMLLKLQPALVDVSREWVAVVLKTSHKATKRKSVFDMPPLNLGRILHSADVRDDLLEDMLDDTRF